MRFHSFSGMLLVYRTQCLLLANLVLVFHPLNDVLKLFTVVQNRNVDIYMAVFPIINHCAADYFLVTMS